MENSRKPIEKKGIHMEIHRKVMRVNRKTKESIWESIEKSRKSIEKQGIHMGIHRKVKKINRKTRNPYGNP